ncbi:MAG: hypothetical protein IJ394_07485 [Bacteroidales bacterium]|nr:hypothetical protein [Bacteroidales bacterium]
MNRYICILIALIGCTSLSAQSFEEYKKKATADYQSYKKQKEDDYKAYRDKMNADFAEYMRKAWEWKKGERAVAPPKKEPDVPPVVLPVLDEPVIPEDKEIPFDLVIPTLDVTPPPVPVMPFPDKPKATDRTLDILFYGTVCKVRFDMDSRPSMADASEESASRMWTELSTERYDNLLHDCVKVREELSLCDWAYYLFAEDVAEKVYGKTNEASMLKAYIMNQSGFRLRLGRSDEGRIHVLMALSDDVYNHPYWIIDGHHYYLTDGSSAESLYIFDRDYPQEQSLRMSIDSPQNLTVKKSSPRRLRSRRYQNAEVTSAVNINLMDFYEDYPHPHQRNNVYTTWAFYADAPVSADMKNSIYPRLKAAIAGKSQREAANILINFVQTGFEYKTDEEAWGYERSFFPEESLYYPFCDCEDRSILFSRLVRDLMGLDVVLLYYPGHLATAVRFDEDIPGDYIVLKSGDYLVCDPTYINASIGMTMPDMDNSTAVVICLGEPQS